MQILFEDRDIIVIQKPAGIATQTAKLGEKDLVSELKNHFFEQAKEAGEPYVGVVHRLDQPVEGILVFGKHAKATKELSRQVEHAIAKKEYYAVVTGHVEEGVHTLIDYLKKDGRSNTSSVVKPTEKDAKRAELSFQLWDNKIKETVKLQDVFPFKEELHLIKINLLTGRHHQIRVQLANAGIPILGDQKYGHKTEGYKGGLNLCAFHLNFQHPGTKKEMDFRITPKNLQILL